MKFFFISFLYVVLISCSFDNKSGIWKSESSDITETNNDLSQFEDLITANSPFKSEFKIEDDYKFNLPNLYSNLEWRDIFYNQYNNSTNFKLNDLSQKSFRSKKTTKQKIDRYILYDDNNVISTDRGGNINIFSICSNSNHF